MPHPFQSLGFLEVVLSERLFECSAPVESSPDSSANYSRIAKAVEMMLAAKLMLLGHHVSVPLEDDGVDLLVNYRVAVQVKSTASRTGTGRLKLKLRENSSAWRRENPARPLLHPRVDVLAVFARDTERWWLIPVSAFEGHVPTQIALTEHLAPMRTKLNVLSSYLDAWWVFEAQD